MTEYTKHESDVWIFKEGNSGQTDPDIYSDVNISHLYTQLFFILNFC